MEETLEWMLEKLIDYAVETAELRKQVEDLKRNLSAAEAQMRDYQKDAHKYEQAVYRQGDEILILEAKIRSLETQLDNIRESDDTTNYEEDDE